MATMTKTRTKSSPKIKKTNFNHESRGTASSDSHSIPALNRKAEPPEESVQVGEEPELRQQIRAEAPDAGTSEFVDSECSFTHGRSQS